MAYHPPMIDPVELDEEVTGFPVPEAESKRTGRGALTQLKIDGMSQAMLRDPEKLEIGAWCWYLHRAKGLTLSDIGKRLAVERPGEPNSLATVSMRIMAYEQIAAQVNPRYSLDALKLTYYSLIGDVRKHLTDIWEPGPGRADPDGKPLSEHSKHQLTQGYMIQLQTIMAQLLKLEGYSQQIGEAPEKQDRLTAEASAKILEAWKASEGVEFEETTRTVRLNKTKPIEGEVIAHGEDGGGPHQSGEAGPADDR